MRTAFLLGLTAVLIAADGRFHQGTAQALPPGADAFVASANALAKSAGERVELGRANTRLRQVRAMLATQLIGGAVAPVKIQLTGLDETEVLCRALRQHLDVASGRNYIQTLGTKIEEVGKPTQIDNIVTAVRTVFQSQSLDIKGPITTKAELDAVVKAQTDRCASDIKAAAEAFYGARIAPGVPTLSSTGPEEVTEVFFSEFATLINVFVGIVTPVIVEGAKIVDEQRRREAIRAFLSNDANRSRIRNVGSKLAEEVSKYALLKRQALAGSVLEKMAAIRQLEVDLTKVDGCKEFASKRFSTRPSGAPSDEFVNCWRAVWARMEEPVSSMLKAAESYDALADAGDSDTAKKQFSELSQALSAIAEGSVTNPEVLWQLATRLVAFGAKIEAAASSDNRKKLETAIDGLMQSL